MNIVNINKKIQGILTAFLLFLFPFINASSHHLTPDQFWTAYHHDDTRHFMTLLKRDVNITECKDSLGNPFVYFLCKNDSDKSRVFMEIILKNQAINMSKGNDEVMELVSLAVKYGKLHTLKLIHRYYPYLDYNTINCQGNPLLYAALNQKELDILQYLIQECKIDLTIKKNGLDPLYYAGNVIQENRFVKFLLQNGANPYIPSFGSDFIAESIKGNLLYLSMVYLYAPHFSFNEKITVHREKIHPLYYALISHSSHAFEFILTHGEYNPYNILSEGSDILAYLINEKDLVTFKKVEKECSHFSFNRNITANNQKKHPLYYALVHNAPEIAEFIFSHGKINPYDLICEDTDMIAYAIIQKNINLLSMIKQYYPQASFDRFIIIRNQKIAPLNLAYSVEDYNLFYWLLEKGQVNPNLYYSTPPLLMCMLGVKLDFFSLLLEYGADINQKINDLPIFDIIFEKENIFEILDLLAKHKCHVAIEQIEERLLSAYQEEDYSLTEALVKLNPPINKIKTPLGNSLLGTAIQQEKKEFILLFQAVGAMVNQAEPSGYTPLQLAAQLEDSDILRQLIQPSSHRLPSWSNALSPCQLSSKQQKQLFKTAYFASSMGCMQYLLDKYKINLNNVPIGKTPILIDGIESDKTSGVIQLLINYGANKQVIDPRNKEDFLYCLIRAGRLDILKKNRSWVQQQLKNGKHSKEELVQFTFDCQEFKIANYLLNSFKIDPNIYINEKTILHHFCLKENLKAIDLLLASPEIIPTDALQDTPLHDMCKEGRVDVIKQFITHKQYLAFLAPDALEKMPLYYLYKRPDSEEIFKQLLAQLPPYICEELLVHFYELEEELATLAIILDQGVSPDACFIKEQTIFYHACQANRFVIAELFLRYGAKPDQWRNAKGETLLTIAYHQQNYALVGLLFDQNSSIVETQDKKKNTIFHEAARNSNQALFTLVKLFYHAKGEDRKQMLREVVNLKNRSGYTVVQIAQQEQQLDALSLIDIYTDSSDTIIELDSREPSFLQGLYLGLYQWTVGVYPKSVQEAQKMIHQGIEQKSITLSTVQAIEESLLHKREEVVTASLYLLNEMARKGISTLSYLSPVLKKASYEQQLTILNHIQFAVQQEQAIPIELLELLLKNSVAQPQLIASTVPILGIYVGNTSDYELIGKLLISIGTSQCTILPLLNSCIYHLPKDLDENRSCLFKKIFYQLIDEEWVTTGDLSYLFKTLDPLMQMSATIQPSFIEKSFDIWAEKQTAISTILPKIRKKLFGDDISQIAQYKALHFLVKAELVYPDILLRYSPEKWQTESKIIQILLPYLEHYESAVEACLQSLQKIKKEYTDESQNLLVNSISTLQEKGVLAIEDMSKLLGYCYPYNKSNLAYLQEPITTINWYYMRLNWLTDECSKVRGEEKKDELGSKKHDSLILEEDDHKYDTEDEDDLLGKQANKKWENRNQFESFSDEDMSNQDYDEFKEDNSNENYDLPFRDYYDSDSFEENSIGSLFKHEDRESEEKPVNKELRTIIETLLTWEIEDQQLITFFEKTKSSTYQEIIALQNFAREEKIVALLLERTQPSCKESVSMASLEKVILQATYQKLDSKDGYPQALQGILKLHEQGQKYSLLKQLLRACQHSHSPTRLIDFVTTLDLVHEYRLGAKEQQAILENLLYANLSRWNKLAHQLIIDRTFLKSTPRQLDAIIAYIYHHSNLTSDDISFQNLHQQVDAMEEAFSQPSQLLQVGEPSKKKEIKTPLIPYSLPIEISSDSIQTWQKKHIRAWAYHYQTHHDQIYDHSNRIPEAIAVLKQACYQSYHFYPYPTQIVALLLLLHHPSDSKGRLLEILTGEGKSLIVIMLAILYGLERKKVDIITTSTELSKREAREKKQFLHLFNLSITENSNANNKTYLHDIVIGIPQDYQGDILHDEYNLSGIRQKRPFQISIIDEVDSMLIDGRNHHLQLSSKKPGMEKLAVVLANIWSLVSRKWLEVEQKGNKWYYQVIQYNADKEQEYTEFYPVPNDITSFIYESVAPTLKVMLRELSREEEKEWKSYSELKDKLDKELLAMRVKEKNEQKSDTTFEELLAQTKQEQAKKIKQSGWIRNQRSPFLLLPKYLKAFARKKVSKWIKNAIRARFYYEKDKQYSVKNNRIVPIDFDNTGELCEDTVWSNGVCQFLEMKEKLPISVESLAPSFISNVAFHQRYESIKGVTGTLGCSKTQKVLSDIYEVTTAIIPSYKENIISNNQEAPYRCKELEHIIVSTQKEWEKVLLEDTLGKINHGRAVLIIFQYIAEAQAFFEKIKQQYSRPEKIYLYTGKTAFRKKKIDMGELIVATYISSRGTDFDTTTRVEAKGGLHVSLTTIPENERIEKQIIGRTGRKGKRGTAKWMIIKKNSILSRNSHSVSLLRQVYRSIEEERLEAALKDFDYMYMRDELFKRACELQTELIPCQERPWGKSSDELPKIQEVRYIREAFEERWSMWLNTQLEEISDDKNKIDKKKIFQAFETFADEVRNDLKKSYWLLNQLIDYTRSSQSKVNYYGRLVQNPIFLVLIGNQHLKEKRYDHAISYYQQAIELDSNASLHVRPNLAYALLEKNTKKADPLIQKQALKHLQKGRQLIDDVGINHLQMINMTVGDQDPTKPISCQIQHNLNILYYYQSYIDEAIKLLNQHIKEEKNTKATLMPLEDIFKDSDEDYSKELLIFTNSGLIGFMQLSEKKPFPTGKVLLVGGLGIAQVAAGALISTYSFGVLGAQVGHTLISEGVSDLWTMAEGCWNGDIDMKQYAIQKSISVTLSVMNFSFSNLRQANHGMMNTQKIRSIGTKGMQSIIQNNALATSKRIGLILFKKVGSEMLSKMADATIYEWITKKLEDHLLGNIEQEISLFVENHDLIQLALTIDQKQNNHNFETRFATLSRDILQKKPKSELVDAVLQYIEGVARGSRTKVTNTLSSLLSKPIMNGTNDHKKKNCMQMLISTLSHGIENGVVLKYVVRFVGIHLQQLDQKIKEIQKEIEYNYESIKDSEANQLVSEDEHKTEEKESEKEAYLASRVTVYQGATHLHQSCTKSLTKLLEEPIRASFQHTLRKGVIQKIDSHITHRIVAWSVKDWEKVLDKEVSKNKAELRHEYVNYHASQAKKEDSFLDKLGIPYHTTQEPILSKYEEKLWKEEAELIDGSPMRDEDREKKARELIEQVRTDGPATSDVIAQSARQYDLHIVVYDPKGKVKNEYGVGNSRKIEVTHYVPSASNLNQGHYTLRSDLSAPNLKKESTSSKFYDFFFSHKQGVFRDSSKAPTSSSPYHGQYKETDHSYSSQIARYFPSLGLWGKPTHQAKGLERKKLLLQIPPHLRKHERTPERIDHLWHAVAAQKQKESSVKRNLPKTHTLLTIADQERIERLVNQESKNAQIPTSIINLTNQSLIDQQKNDPLEHFLDDHKAKCLKNNRFLADLNTISLDDISNLMLSDKGLKAKKLLERKIAETRAEINNCFFDIIAQVTSKTSSEVREEIAKERENNIDHWSLVSTDIAYLKSIHSEYLYTGAGGLEVVLRKAQALEIWIKDFLKKYPQYAKFLQEFYSLTFKSYNYVKYVSAVQTGGVTLAINIVVSITLHQVVDMLIDRVEEYLEKQHGSNIKKAIAYIFQGIDPDISDELAAWAADKTWYLLLQTGRLVTHTKVAKVTAKVCDKLRKQKELSQQKATKKKNQDRDHEPQKKQDQNLLKEGKDHTCHQANGIAQSKKSDNLASGKSVHGNSRDSQKKQTGYMIRHRITRKVQEYGITGQQNPINRIRAKLRKKYNNDPDFEGVILEEGMKNRREALAWEQQMVDKWFDKKIRLFQQDRPKPSKLKK